MARAGRTSVKNLEQASDELLRQLRGQAAAEADGAAEAAGAAMRRMAEMDGLLARRGLATPDAPVQPDAGRVVRLLAAVADVRTHVDSWTRLLGDLVEMLPPDHPPSAEDPEGSSRRGHAEHELRAMRRDLKALLDA